MCVQSEEGFLQRGRPRNNLVPMHVNVTCRAYFGLSGLSDYGQVSLETRWYATFRHQVPTAACIGAPSLCAAN